MNIGWFNPSLAPLVAVLSQAPALAQFTTVIDVPPDVAPTSLGSNTQLNLYNGGTLTSLLIVGSSGGGSTNVEFNMFGGQGVDSDSYKIENWSGKVKFSQVSSDSTKLYWQEFTFPDKKYMKMDLIKFDINSLEKFTGNYICSELDLNCHIKQKNNQLFLSDTDDKESALEPLFKDTFKSSFRGKEIIVEFNRDVNNKKVAMSMNTILLKNLRFNKQ